MNINKNAAFLIATIYIYVFTAEVKVHRTHKGICNLSGNMLIKQLVSKDTIISYSYQPEHNKNLHRYDTFL